MHSFTSILFSPLGVSDNAAAVRRVADLAHQTNAKLTLFGVLSEPSGIQRVLHRPEFFLEVQEADRQTLTKRLDRWADKNRDGRIEVAIEVGSQAVRIIERVVNEVLFNRWWTALIFGAVMTALDEARTP